MGQYRFNVVMGEPTWLIRLTELAEHDGGGKLKLMIGGAEEMPAEAVAWMKDVWGGVTVKMCYGSVEQGVSMAFQPCDHHEGYHLDILDFLPEMIEPDADGYGELVFTTLRRTTMPLIRYRTRDVTRFMPACPCGIHTPRIEKLRGRRDELVVASGGNLYPLMFENILKPVAGLGLDFQTIFRLEGVREILEIHVETTRRDEEAVFAEIKNSATDQYPDLMKNLALGIFQMRLCVHLPGTIRTGRKLKRMIDRRFVAEKAEPDFAAEGVADEQLV
jgi:phenylacetate-CoA ligase